MIHTLTKPRTVIAYWQDVCAAWFLHRPGFGRAFAKRFTTKHTAAQRGDLRSWEARLEGCLALLILLAQYPRNAFRAAPAIYATDRQARRVARQMVARDLIEHVPPKLQLFCLLPFSHSEDLADQHFAIRLYQQFLTSGLGRARRHCSIIERFCRFPHRNAILGRTSTTSERRFLQQGGFQG